MRGANGNEAREIHNKKCHPSVFIFVVEGNTPLNVRIQLQWNARITDDVARGAVERAENVPARSGNTAIWRRGIICGLPRSFHLQEGNKRHISRKNFSLHSS